MTISTIGQQLDPLWQAAQNAASTTTASTDPSPSGGTQTSPAIIMDISGDASGDSASTTTMTRAERDAAKAALKVQEEAAEAQAKAEEEALEAAAKAAKEAAEAAEDIAKAEAKAAEEAAEAQAKAEEEALEAAEKAAKEAAEEAEDLAKAQAKAEEEALEAAEKAAKEAAEEAEDLAKAQAKAEEEALEAAEKAAKEAAEEAEDLAKAQAKADEEAAEAAAKAAKDASRSGGDPVAGPAGATAAQGPDGAKENGFIDETGAVASRASENSRAFERAGPKEKGWNKVDDSLTATVRPEEVQEAEEDVDIAASREAAKRVQARMMQESVISLISSTDKVGITLKPIENVSTERAGGSYAAATPKPDAVEARQRVSVAA
ncbi:hypothetical protein O4G76_10765 [Limimaricola sp. G21655-S1]|uniref:hypothetical protein n=1 Tax=Limimaricola sp. G21655-S1 TaxID=3014768 RepID=UPI0022AF3466|nr:hypothetical protein [Limimaricola sp. G21655-S1]MCZ4261321.1 hypothetical protein [Limimaricola sp. G21655-S1]